MAIQFASPSQNHRRSALDDVTLGERAGIEIEDVHQLLVPHLNERPSPGWLHARHIAPQVVLGKGQMTRFVPQNAGRQTAEQRILPRLMRAERAIEMFGDDVAEQDAPDPVGAIALTDAV